MKIYVINLKRRHDRLLNIINKFNEFGFSNYEIIEAIDANDHSYESLQHVYDSKHAKRLQRELSLGEISCALSHQKAYHQILKNKDSHGIVIEDDCPITQELINFCNGEPPVLEILLLGYYTSNEMDIDQSYDYDILDICSGTRVYFTNNKIQNYFEFDMQSRKTDFLHGAHCYCISKIGCNTILKYNAPIILEADNTWNYFHDIKVFGIRPMLVEISRDRATSDLEHERGKLVGKNEFSKYFSNRIISSTFGT